MSQWMSWKGVAKKLFKEMKGNLHSFAKWYT